MTQTTTPTIRTAAALYAMTRTMWTGNWKRCPISAKSDGLPNVARIVQRGTVEEALDAMKTVYAKGEWFATQTQSTDAARATHYALATARARIAYRALLIVADADRADYHAKSLVKMIAAYTGARYRGPVLGF